MDISHLETQANKGLDVGLCNEVLRELIGRIKELEAQTVTMCKMLDGVTTSVSKTDTVHALTCIKIDEFLEKEFKLFTRK